MGDKNPSSVKSYDDVLDIIGQFGPWQMRIFFYLWLTSAAGGLAVVVYTFTAFSTPYQCEISQCQTKYNGSHWITLDQGKLIPTPPGQCQYYGIAKRPTKDLTCADYVSDISDNSVDKINETCGGESLVFDKTYVTSSLSKYFLHLQLEMIHFTGDIYEKHVLQHLLPFTISKIFHFSRQKLVLR